MNLDSPLPLQTENAGGASKTLLVFTEACKVQAAKGKGVVRLGGMHTSVEPDM